LIRINARVSARVANGSVARSAGRPIKKEQTMTTLEVPRVRAKAPSDLSAWRTVLAHVEPATTPGPHLRAAVDLARKCDALLIGVGAETVNPALRPYEGWNAGTVEALHEEIKKNLAMAQKTFHAAAAAASVRSELLVFEERPAAAMARLCRAADVIVAGGVADDGFRQADAVELALLSGRPVLVAPSSGRSLRAESILVAWKDTREARRALADALPLLAAAEDVVVLEVCTDDSEDAAQARTDDVVSGLKRHGIDARARVVSAPDSGAAEMIEAEARALGADVIVSGCYGHSRLGEWLFGGVTRGLLNSPGCFLLISH
jgi:nucleotide-binding universal stress UspA family protein